MKISRALFVFLLFFSQMAFAVVQGGGCAKPVDKVFLDNFTFICIWECQTPRNIPKYFLFPSSACFKDGSTVSMYDGKNRFVGSIQLGKIENHPINYAQVDKISEKKPVFQNLNSWSKSLNVDLMSLWESYLKLNFSEYITAENLKTNLYIWGAAEIKVLKLNPDYFAISGFSSPDAVPHVTSIDWSQLIELLKKGAKTMDARQTNSEGWALPNGIEYGTQASVLNENWSEADFILNRNILSNKMLPSDQKTPIVVYSNHAREHSAYNLLRLLVFKGYKNLYWYEEGSGGFFGQRSIPDLQIPGIEKRDLKYIVQNLDKLHIVEASDQELPNGIGRIPNNYMAKFHFDSQVILNTPIRNLSDLDPVSPHLYLNFIPQAKLDAMVKEEAIVYGKNQFDQIPYYVAALLKLNGYQKISLYTGGLDEWRSARKWKIKGVYLEMEDPEN